MGKILIDEEELNELIFAAKHDRLTGALNRYGGEMIMEKIMEEQATGYLAVLDVDNFKSINDTYGHDVGDIVLRVVAHTFKDVINDGVVRIGGDEFGTFCRTTEIKGSINEMFSTLTERISTIDIPEMKGNKISISIGIAYYDGSSDTIFRDLYHKADRLCYLSKKETNNKVTVE